MNEHYEKWEKDSPRWRTDLDKKLADYGGSDVVIQYRDVARAFPSRMPHPSTFDYPRIDRDALKAWASARGWEVNTAPDSKPGRDLESPRIRFTKK